MRHSQLPTWPQRHRLRRQRAALLGLDFSPRCSMRLALDAPAGGRLRLAAPRCSTRQRLYAAALLALALAARWRGQRGRTRAHRQRSVLHVAEGQQHCRQVAPPPVGIADWDCARSVLMMAKPLRQARSPCSWPGVNRRRATDRSPCQSALLGSISPLVADGEVSRKDVSVPVIALRRRR